MPEDPLHPEIPLRDSSSENRNVRLTPAPFRNTIYKAKPGAKIQDNDKTDTPTEKPRKRGVIFVITLTTVVAHVLGVLGFAAIKVINTYQTVPEFEAAPIAITRPPPPAPPPPPTTRHAQRSLPRPEALAVRNPQNLEVPSIEIKDSSLTVAGGRGFGGGLGELGGAVAEALRITSFGFDKPTENTLEGTLFDFKRDARGNPIAGQEPGKLGALFREFTRNFNVGRLESNYFSPDRKLYGSYFIMPNQRADAAPEAFGVSDIIQPKMIGIVYKGTFRAHDSGKFRFYGRGDDVLIVRINGKIVLDASWALNRYSEWSRDKETIKEDKQNVVSKFGIRMPGVSGDWFNLRKGDKVDIDILVSEVPGGLFGAYLLIEKRGQQGYEIFSTRALSAQDKQFLLESHADAAKLLD